MGHAYYSQAAMTATGESILTHYPQFTNTNQYISMYYPPQAASVHNTAATIKELKREFVSQTQRPRSITPKSKSSAPQNQNVSRPYFKSFLSESHLAIGMIVFVQQKSEDERNCRCVLPDYRRRKLEAKGYNHPAVVLDIQDHHPNGGELTALCCMISANPQPHSEERSSNFTITQVKSRNGSSSDVAPNGATILHLESNGTMHKKSHIIDSHIYAIPISQLANFGTPLHHRLTEKSYRNLISVFPSIIAPEWIETAKLLSGAKSSRPSPIPTPTPEMISAPVSAPAKTAVSSPNPIGIPAKVGETIAALLQYLSKEQIIQVVPEMFDEYPQLIECFT